MAREPFKPIELSAKLRPVAAPVDTFVRAQEPSRDTNLQDLARSLSNLGGSLGGLVGQRDQEAKEQDKIRGEALYWQSNQMGSADAIAKGIIPAQASPDFLRAYKRLEGETAGGLLEQKFSAAYDAWPGKTSTDPKAYDAFVGSFIKDSLNTDDPDILKGMLPKIHQVASNYLQRHISDTSRSVMSGATTALAAKQDRALTDANSAGLSSAQGTDYKTVFERVETIRGEGLATGMNEQEVDKKLVDTITARAIDLRDPKLLDFLARKVPGKEYSWDSTPYGREQRQTTINTLEAMGRRSIADDESRRRDEKAAAKDAVTRDTIQAITRAPNEPIPEDLLARGEKVDPDFRVNAIRWRDTIGKGTQTSDNGDMLAVTTDILNGGGVARVQRGIREGVFKNPEDLTRAYKLAESMDKDGPKIADALKGGSAKTILDTIKKHTASDKDASQFFDDGSVSPEGLQAQTDFKLQVLAWRQANPEANAIEQEKAIADIGAGILKRIQQPEVMGPVGYDRGGIQTPNTFGAKAPPMQMPKEAGGPAQPTAPTQRGAAPLPLGNEAGEVVGSQPAPRAAPQAPASSPASASDWFNGLPPETKAILERKAAEEKKPLSLKMQEAYDRGVAAGAIKPAAPVQPQAAPGRQSAVAPDGTPIELASATTSGTEGIGQAFREAIDTPPPADQVRLIGEAFERAIAGAGKGKPAGGYVSTQLRDDPQAARILDFVAGPESAGNYNAYFGNTRSTKDLSQMSLDEVIAWSGNRGTKSSATGRYQFMKATLGGETKKGEFHPGLKQELGLSGREKFTPELQDRLALALLERRGYSDFKAGRISAEKFGNNLALEWASLPNITAQNGRPAGVSAYAGDGLNAHAKGLSREKVLAAITGGEREPASTAAPGFLGRLFGRGRSKPASRPGDGETRV